MEAPAPHPDIPPAPPPSSASSGPVEEPAGYRMEDFRTPVPATLRGARVLTNDDAADLWNRNGAAFIDVYPQAPKPPNLPAGTFWRDPVHRSIEGAVWMPNVGYGALSQEMEEYFRARLDAISHGKRDAPLVFFCLKDCWMSWNAAKRALEYGYTNVLWFPDGTDGWQELGYPLVAVKKLP
ncbi:MAG TPA: PQQ-dependent catabolism-associated CXXCW motif protein [Hyphomicrobium sp.]|nr:PQQ-dependent catabolism-associated CXXCW motif protein [Hyphomicrobium sp.]